MQFYDRQCNLLNDNICLSIYTYNTCYADMTFINIKAQHSDSTHDALMSYTSELGQEVEGGVYGWCVNGLTTNKYHYYIMTSVKKHDDNL